MKERFFIITNDYKDPALTVTGRVKAFLDREGVPYEGALLSALRQKIQGTEADTVIPDDTGICLVLGGDGTMLEAAHFLHGREIPLLGVNLGNIGYLTEVAAQEVESALSRVLAGSYTTDHRMMIEGRVFRGNDTQPVAVWQSLNDIVIARYGSIRMLRLHIEVNGSALCDYHADGVVLSTPTGSTGYNMSAGGPIVEPVARLLLLTPISAHTLSPRSIVLSPDDRIRVTIQATHEHEEAEAEISFDAAHTERMRPGDSIEIFEAKRATRIIRLEQTSFLDVLHSKLV